MAEIAVEKALERMNPASSRGTGHDDDHGEHEERQRAEERQRIGALHAGHERG
jgi:hypothetical protein